MTSFRGQPKTREVNPGATEFDAAVERLCDLLEGDGPLAAPEDLDRVTAGLTKFVKASFWRLSLEAEDLVQDALIRFMEAVRSGKVDRRQRPAAYLTTILRNLALSRLRSAPPEEDLGLVPSVLGDDAIAALLDKAADSTAIRRALSVAARNGDHTAVRVVVSWLDLASRLGTSPSSRDVAKIAYVSHTAVRLSLLRFRSYFSD